MSNPSDRPDFHELTQSLKQAAEAFLKNMNDATGANPTASTDEQKTAQKTRTSGIKVATIGAADGFESVMDRLRQRMARIPSATVEPPPSASAPPPTPQVAAPSAPPPPLMQALNALLVDMGASSSPLPHSWSGLDHAVTAVRSAWVRVLTEANAPQASLPPSASAWLQSWEEIIVNIQGQSLQWPSPHGSTWNKQAAVLFADIESLKPWIGVQPQSPQDILDVPSSFIGAGVVPTPPIDVPSSLVEDLQRCADFWEWASTQSPSAIAWTTGPSQAGPKQYALEACYERLKAWEPASPAAQQWHDKAQDRYAVLLARLSLHAVASPASTPKNKGPLSR